MPPPATIVPACTSSTTGDKIRRTNRVKVALICCIFLWMAPLSARVTDDPVTKIADDPRSSRGLAWIDKNSAWVTEQQIRLTEIPAPEFEEVRRGAALRNCLPQAVFRSASTRPAT